MHAHNDAVRNRCSKSLRVLQSNSPMRHTSRSPSLRNWSWFPKWSSTSEQKKYIWYRDIQYKINYTIGKVDIVSIIQSFISVFLAQRASAHVTQYTLTSHTPACIRMSPHSHVSRVKRVFARSQRCIPFSFSKLPANTLNERRQGFSFAALSQRGDGAALIGAPQYSCLKAQSFNTHIYICIYNRMQLVQINLYTYWSFRYYLLITD